MRKLRNAVVHCTLGAVVLATPEVALAAPGADVVNSADDARPAQKVARDEAGRTIVHVAGRNDAQLRSAVQKAGGVVAGAVSGRLKAAVPGDRLNQLSSQPGVTEVRLPERAIPMAVTSEGVGLSKADTWIQAGKKGANVKVGVIDVGFGGLAEAQAAGELPPTGPRLTVDGTGCLDSGTHTEHGTAVAEVVHDMAPEAALHLACVEDSVSFATAADRLQQQGVQVITAAIGFLSPAGGRGDGSGPDTSPAGVVRNSRAAGILWSVAAGNQARLHFAGKAADANGNSFVEFKDSAENNAFTLQGNSTGTVSIRWDAWPATNEDLDLYVMSRPHAPTGANDPDVVAVSSRNQKDAPGGLSPTEEVTFANTSAVGATYYVYAKNNSARFTTPFDLFVAGPGDGQLQYSTAAGSITEPATSPHVIAVGATESGSGQVEASSSRGPTVDGRQKPDITAFDRVSTRSWGPGAFAGTSAAAAHVAGAAALLKSDNQALDAAQLQSVLQSRANPKRADSTWGNGTLHLGLPGSPAMTGSGFTALPTPARVQSQAYSAGQVVTLAFPDVPGDTTAVAITVSARSDEENVIHVTPGDPATSSSRATGVQVRRGNTFSALTFFAPLGPDRAVRIRSRSSNSWVVVDHLGYFSPSQSTDNYFAKPAPQRVLDTRGFSGSPRSTPLAAGQSQEVRIRGAAGVADTATSVAVNVTGFEATTESFLLARGAGTPATTTVAVGRGERRSGLTVVPIDQEGKIHVVNNTASGLVGAAVDVVGWFGPGAGGAKYVTLPEATRITDTATGNGLPNTPVGHGQMAGVQVGGVAGVSRAATAAALVVTGLDPVLGTELSVAPREASWTPVTSIATRKAEAAAGLVLSPLGESGQVDVRNERGQAQLAVDVTGYFIGGAKATAGGCAPAQDGPGFGAAFDGRAESDLEGWLSTGTKIGADSCELVTQAGGDVTWYAAHTYGNDYTVKVDWKATTDNSDSGVFVLMTDPGTDAAAPGRTGYEVQIGAKNASGTLRTGSFAAVQAPIGTVPVKPTGEWNTFEIKVRWNTATVYLNGQKINEYTSPDATRIGRNTFVGLQNHGGNAPVRFRNVRIKRDTPVVSGSLKGVNGRCLDVKGGDPHQPVVWMWDCSGNFAQTWSTHQGMVLAGGRCLVATGIGDEGAPVELGRCAATDLEQWVHRTDGRLVNRSSGRCATPVSGDRAALLVLRACDGSRAEQVWQKPEQNGRAGMVTGLAGKCLDVVNHDPLLNRAQLWSCNGTGAQSWTAPGDGTLRGDGRCLDVAGEGTADGTAVNLWECAGNQAQQWLAQPDGTLVNPRSGRCLTAVSTDDGAALQIKNCTAARTQVWRHTAEWLFRGPIVGIGAKCVDVHNNDPNAGGLWLWDCHGPGGQLWWTPGDGTVRVYGKCLDVPGEANFTPIGIVGCNGFPHQQWTARPDGTVVSALSGRCTDVQFGNTENGTPLQVVDCHRAPYQRWATPVNPS